MPAAGVAAVCGTERAECAAGRAPAAGGAGGAAGPGQGSGGSRGGRSKCTAMGAHWRVVTCPGRSRWAVPHAITSCTHAKKCCLDISILHLQSPPLRLGRRRPAAGRNGHPACSHCGTGGGGGRGAAAVAAEGEEPGVMHVTPLLQWALCRRLFTSSAWGSPALYMGSYRSYWSVLLDRRTSKAGGARPSATSWSCCPALRERAARRRRRQLRPLTARARRSWPAGACASCRCGRRRRWGTGGQAM